MTPRAEVSDALGIIRSMLEAVAWIDGMLSIVNRQPRELLVDLCDLLFGMLWPYGMTTNGSFPSRLPIPTASLPVVEMSPNAIHRNRHPSKSRSETLLHNLCSSYASGLRPHLDSARPKKSEEPGGGTISDEVYGDGRPPVP